MGRGFDGPDPFFLRRSTASSGTWSLSGLRKSILIVGSPTAGYWLIGGH